MIVLNASAYLGLLTRRVSSLSGHDKSSKKLLKANYVLKSVSVILTCLVLSGNIASIKESIDHYRQRDFFEQKRDYNWYQRIALNSGEFSTGVQKRLYKEFIDDMDIWFLCYSIGVSGTSKTECIANKNTKDYLIEQIEGFGELDFTKEAYILIHENENISDKALEELKMQVNADEFEVFYYKSNSEIIVRCLSSEPDTKLEKNPIVLFYNTDEMPTPELMLYMIKTDKAKLEDFAQTYGMSYTETNALSYYNFKAIGQRRALYLNIILSVLMIILEILITATVIRLEYAVNATQLALEKVLGYSNVRRFYSLYIISAALWAISMLLAVIASKLLNIGNSVQILIGGIVILVFDMTIISLNTMRFDRLNIQKILKGGAL